MKRTLRLLLTTLALLTPLAASAQGGGEELDLGLRRDFGYRGGDRIQGKFSMLVSGPDDLARVDFTIDGQAVGSDDQPPFETSFNTGDYALGRHTLAAVGTTADGRVLRSQARSFTFISPEEGLGSATRIVVPILIAALGLTLIGALGPASLVRLRKPFRPGAYGAAGGAVCPRCGLPFPRHLLSPNLLFGKLERCPHCGQWSLASRASADQLDAAEARLAEENRRGGLESIDETSQWKQRIEDSRFEG